MTFQNDKKRHLLVFMTMVHRKEKNMKTVNQLQAELMKQKEAYQTSQKKLKAELRKAQKEAEREARIAEQKKMNEENKIVCDFLRTNFGQDGVVLFDTLLQRAMQANNEKQS